MTRKEDLHVVKSTTTVDEGMFEHCVCVGCLFVNYMLIYWYLLSNHYSSRDACGEENNRLPCDWWWLDFGNFQYLFALTSLIKDLFLKQSQIDGFTQFSLSWFGDYRLEFCQAMFSIHSLSLSVSDATFFKWHKLSSVVIWYHCFSAYWYSSYRDKAVGIVCSNSFFCSSS